MALLHTLGLVPLTHSTYTTVLHAWRYFTLVAPIQLSLSYYPMGKTALPSSPLRLPGRASWITMELVSPASFLFFLSQSSSTSLISALASLHPTHILLTTLYLLHYIHRALVSPLRNHSMADNHWLTFLSGVGFNLINGGLLGAWIGGFGNASAVPAWQVGVGSILWAAGLAGNIYHEEILREIRRSASSKGAAANGEVVKHGSRVYAIPHGGLYEYLWLPHFFCEWVEWAGYCVAGGGLAFQPAVWFLVNEIATMGPRALQQRDWYLRTFGDAAKRLGRWAVVPGFV